MAVEETVGVKVQVDGTKATEQIGSIRAQIKAATVSVVEAQQKFGDYSKEALEAAKRLATLKDRIAEANETANLFDPGKKFQALSGSIQAVAGAFSAAQGAIGLLGVESAEVEKAILRVQSAMALSQGLSAIADSAKDFERLGAIIKSNVITSLTSLRAAAVSSFATMRASAVAAFTTIRGALIATGVGAFAVALGLIVANFDAIKAAVLRAIPGLANVGKLFGNLVTQVTDFVGITNEADRALEKFTKTSERKKESLQSEIKIRQAAGASVKELSDLEKRIINEDLEQLRRKSKTKNGLSTEEQKKFRELKTEELVIDARVNKAIADENAKRIQKIEADNKAARDKKIAEDNKRKEEEKKKAEEEAAELKKNQDRVASEDETIRNRNADKFLTDQEKEIEAVNAKYTKQLEDRIKFGGDEAVIEEARNEELLRIKQKYDDAELEQLSATTEETVQIIKKGEEQNTKNLKAQSDKNIKISEAEKQAKINNLKATADIFGALAGLAEQGTATQKALSLAQLAINTGIAISNLVATSSAPTPDNIASGGLSGFAKYATGIITILSNIGQARSIINSVPGGGGGGSTPGLGSTPSAGAGAPIAPRGMDPIPTSLDQRSLNSISNVTTRAYVVESDITGSQQRVSRLEKAARF